jgi:hypothetical protein
MIEQILIEDIKQWLKKVLLNSSSYLIKEEVNFKIGDFRFRGDLIAIQSKSNVIHGFEIKSNLTLIDIHSAISQTYSYYTNYRWLVMPKNSVENLRNIGVQKSIAEFGIGIISFDQQTKEFFIVKEAKYNDGNFLKFLPDLKTDWENKIRTSKG